MESKKKILITEWPFDYSKFPRKIIRRRSTAGYFINPIFHVLTRPLK